MDVATVQHRVEQCQSELALLGVQSLLLFGSAARGASPQGDLDFLVEFTGPTTFDRFMAVRELLERTFDREIDLVTRPALKPQLLKRIAQEAIRVA